MIAFKIHLVFILSLFSSTILIPVSAFAQNDSNYVSKKISQTYIGTASYYAEKFVGKKTASGEHFNQKKMTAACNILPIGTRVRVTNLKNNKSVIVMINDRLHAKNRRLIDLTFAAAKKLDFINIGLAKVRVEKLSNLENRSKR